MHWNRIEEGLWYLSYPDAEGDQSVVAWVSRRERGWRWVCLGRSGRSSELSAALQKAEDALASLKRIEASLAFTLEACTAA